jgi:ankyrin repeat protein
MRLCEPFVVLLLPPFFFFFFFEVIKGRIRMEERLLAAVDKIQISEVRELLTNHPELDVNWKNFADSTALHFACIHGHPDLVGLLLSHPAIGVNQRDAYGQTPFLLGCWLRNVEVVKLLLKDGRTDCGLTEKDGRTPLWCASWKGHHEVIKWMLAIRGSELGFEKNSIQSCIEAASTNHNPPVVELLENFMAQPIMTRNRLQGELELSKGFSAELFAMVIFLCDDFLQLRWGQETIDPELERFLKIVIKLPMELQMVLCHRVYGSSREIVTVKDSNAAFEKLCKTGFLDLNE